MLKIPYATQINELALVKRVIGTVEGNICVHSFGGEGTTFKVYLEEKR